MTKRSTDFSEQSWWGMQNLEWFASTKVRTDYFSIESALIVFSTTSADGEYIRFAVLSSSWNCEEFVEERATLGYAKKSSRELEDSLITRRFQAHPELGSGTGTHFILRSLLLFNPFQLREGDMWTITEFWILVFTTASLVEEFDPYTPHRNDLCNKSLGPYLSLHFFSSERIKVFKLSLVSPMTSLHSRLYQKAI